MSLKKKILLLVFIVSMICPIIAGVIIQRNLTTTDSYIAIAEGNLPKVVVAGEVLSKFREIRIQVRSIPITNNTKEDIEKYLIATLATIDDFLKSKEQLSKLLQSNEEKNLAKKAEDKWNAFYTFGGELIRLIKKGDSESMREVSELVRVKCPIYALAFDNAMADIIAYQKRLAEEKTLAAKKLTNETLYISVVAILLGVIGGIIGGSYVAKRIGEQVIKLIEDLSTSTKEINNKSSLVSRISANLSEASKLQASSLQVTAASIDEISSMVNRNTDHSLEANLTSKKSFQTVQDGKLKMESMMEAISSIAEGNQEVSESISTSNREISQIVKVIEDISEKTKIINDIVFQTKLLSFNASVEAARAGEHGKGFSVVAEEIGNLATMSGNASKEIADMLSESVERVTVTVAKTNKLLADLNEKSKTKVATGLNVAGQCVASFDEILGNVSNVDNAIREISAASQEQSIGVKEVNKTINELDSVAQKYASTAIETNKASDELNTQATNLNRVVEALNAIVVGGFNK